MFLGVSQVRNQKLDDLCKQANTSRGQGLGSNQNLQTLKSEDYVKKQVVTRALKYS